MYYDLAAYAGDFASFLIQNLKGDARQIKSIILFGSVARGEAGKDSDIDLFIDVTEEKVEKSVLKIRDNFFHSIKSNKYWALFGIKNEIHCTVGKLEQWKELAGSLVANGILLYGKYQGTSAGKQYYLFTIVPTSKKSKNVSVWRKLYGYKQIVGKKTYLKKGLLEELGGQRFAKSVFVVPAEHLGEMKAFLQKSRFRYQLISIRLEK